MKRSHLTILSSFLLVLAMCLTLPACKKKDAEAPAADAVKAADAGKVDAGKADGTVKYDKAAQLSLFKDGQILHFGVKSDLEEGTDKKGIPGWKCDEETCNAKFEYDIDCTVKLIANEATYCISELKCAAKGGVKMTTVFPAGLWGIDSYGVHYSNNADLKRRGTPGCEDSEGCEPGTMMYEYENFDDEYSDCIDFDDTSDWLVYFNNFFNPSESDEEEGYFEGCMQKGSLWKCSKGERAGYVFVWDEQRGIVKFRAFYIEGDESRGIELDAK